MNPIKELKQILNPDTNQYFGKVVRISSNEMVISSKSGVSKTQPRSGYYVGMRVIVDASGNLVGKASSSKKIPVYVV